MERRMDISSGPENSPVERDEENKVTVDTCTDGLVTYSLKGQQKGRQKGQQRHKQ